MYQTVYAAYMGFFISIHVSAAKPAFFNCFRMKLFISIVFAQNTKTLCLDKKERGRSISMWNTINNFLSAVDNFVLGSAAHGAHHGRRYNAHSSSGASSDEKASSGTKVDGQK